MKLPLAPVQKHKTLKQESESESMKNLLNSSTKSKGIYRPPSSNTKIAINCETNKNILSQSMRSTKSLKMFNFDNDSSSDEGADAFNNLIQQQKEDQYYQVEKFLRDIHLKELFDVFIQNKIYDLDTINALTDPFLKKMKITEKHRETILNHIKFLKESKMNSNIVEMSTQCENTNTKDQDILDMEENERIQSELFKKAVEEFRRGGSKKESTLNNINGVDSSITTNNTNEPEITISNPKKFLMEIGGNELFNLNNLALFADEGNDVKDDQEYLPELSIGKACWNCYKLIYDAYPLNVDQKFFCSEKCLKAYKGKNEIKCGFCNKLFYKNNGIVHKNKIFCSVDCFNKDSNKIEEKENEEEEEVQNDTKVTEENKENSEEMIDILDI